MVAGGVSQTASISRALWHLIWLSKNASFANIFVTSSGNVSWSFFVTIRSSLYKPFSTTENDPRPKINIYAFPIPVKSVMSQPSSS